MKSQHMVRVFRAKDGGPMRSAKRKRPAGMSGRQWKKFYKAQRRKMVNRTDEFAAIP